MIPLVNDPFCFCGGAGLIPSPVQWLKDPALPQLWYRFQGEALIWSLAQDISYAAGMAKKGKEKEKEKNPQDSY